MDNFLSIAIIRWIIAWSQNYGRISRDILWKNKWLHFSLSGAFSLYGREGFFWSLPSIYTYLTDQCIRDPVQIRGNNELSVACEPNSSDASVFTEIRRSALRAGTGFCSFSAFLREQRFCERKSRTHLSVHEYTRYVQRRTPRRATPWSRISRRDKVVEPDMRSGFVASGRTDRRSECRLFRIE